MANTPTELVTRDRLVLLRLRRPPVAVWPALPSTLRNAAVRCTLLILPGGEAVYNRAGIMNPLELLLKRLDASRISLQR